MAVQAPAMRPAIPGFALRERLAQAWVRHPRRVDLAIATLVGLVVFAVYNATLTPSLSYVSPDGNELATTSYTLGLAHPTGYPLYTWLGKAFTFIPIGDVAHRVNLLSAVGAAGACALLYAICRELALPRPVAAFAGLFFGFSTSIWSQATISEVYAPNLFFVALALYLMLLWGRHQRDPHVARHGDLRSTLLFGGWALTLSASTGTHMSSLGFLPGYGVYILMVNWRVLRQPLVLVPGLVLFALGLMQFLWLPIRTVMGEPTPDPINPATFDGFLNYTVNAFPQFKWAFPLEMLPDRFILYSALVRWNFGFPGIAVGILGAAGLALRRPRTFILLALMWAVHTVFFMEYRAMDIDVFFIPAHFLFAIAIASGVWLIIQGIRKPLTRIPAGGAVAGVLTFLVLFLPVRAQLRYNYATHDQSTHTEINDFYENAYRLLPKDSVLLGSAGVFGYDMFYYQYVYNLRPDVIVPSAGLAIGQRASWPTDGRERFSVDPSGAWPNRFRPETGSNEWSIPVLVTPAHDRKLWLRRDLVLYRLSATPPDLVDDSSTPSIGLNLRLGGVTLIGADLDTTTVKAGETVKVRLYWKFERIEQAPIIIAVGDDDDAPIARRQPGSGLVERYDREVAPVRGHTVVEEFELVVLSSTGTGVHPLTIRSAAPDAEAVTVALLNVE